MDPSPIRYVDSQGYQIAWQEFGSGAEDLAFIWANPNHIDSLWDWPSVATFLRALGGLGRAVHMDQRGTGLSDRVTTPELPDLNERVDDVMAVLDAAGIDDATLLADGAGAAVAVCLAAEHPDRVRRLVLLSPRLRDQFPAEARNALLDLIEQHWGEPLLLDAVFPSQANDPRFRDWWARHLRLCASPAAARALLEMEVDIDVTPMIHKVSAPTLVIHHEDDISTPPSEIAPIVAEFPQAELRLTPGNDTIYGAGPGDAEALAAIADLVGRSGAADPALGDRYQRAVLFTDIVESTAQASRLGDRAWRKLLDDHDLALTRAIDERGGRWVKSTGDGVVATFERTEDAAAAARLAAAELAELGLRIRAGIHLGAVDRRGADISGMSVHVAARVAALADDDEILLTASAANQLDADAKRSIKGTYTLKGVPGEWQLWTVT